MTIWNERYATAGFAFGRAPNAYIKSVIDPLPPGRLLVPGAGEGRDAVYAAKRGWEVHAFDLSMVGMEKALQWAAEENVTIRYDVLDAADFDFDGTTYDLVAMTFFHLPPTLRKLFFNNLHRCLAPGGRVALEAFNPRQLPYRSGGPKDIAMLLTPTILNEELTGIEPVECVELLTTLDEGNLHRGEAEVIRYLGKVRS